MRRLLLIVLACATVSAPACAETFTSMLSDDGKTVSYTPCSVEDAAECISHDINCRGDDGFGDGLAMILLGASSENPPDTRKLAKALIDKEFGEAKVKFTVAGKSIDVPANAVTISLDELNGDWDLSLHFLDSGSFFDVLNETAVNVSADVAGYRVPLASTKADAANLMKFKQACSR